MATARRVVAAGAAPFVDYVCRLQAETLGLQALTHLRRRLAFIGCDAGDRGGAQQNQTQGNGLPALLVM
jgi:hypothetical protein